MVDRTGAVLYYRLFAPLQVLNFQQQLLPDAGIQYSYYVTDPKNPQTAATRLMDRNFNDTQALTVLPYGNHGAIGADPHDFIWLGDDHYVVQAALPQTVDLSGFNPTWSRQATVVAAVVQEVDHGEVVFEWNSTNNPSLYLDSVDGNGFALPAAADYVHLNSMQVDPQDGNFILSMRHTNSVIKVDRTSGSTIWTLGGRSDDFGLIADERFSHQHFARMLPEHTLLLFDNGNNAHQTRVMSFQLDEAQRAAVSYSVDYSKPADQVQTTFMGSVIEYPGERYLIGWGGWVPPLVAPPSVTEVVGGTVTWSLTFASPSVFSYRALPIDTW
jgi:hypothetical protein